MTQERDLHDQISQLAYQIYEARHRVGEHGNELTDWLKAEQRILDERSRIEITVLTDEYDYSQNRVYAEPRTEDEERQLVRQQLAEADLQAFFRIVGGSERPSKHDANYWETVRSLSFPEALAPFVTEGLTDEKLGENSGKVEVSIPIINSRTSRGELFGGGGGEWAWAQAFATAITAICAAGGTKMVIELLKAWVEERKGRRIRIKKGDYEIEVQGGMTKAQVDQLIKTFEEKVRPSNIIIP